MSSSRINRPPPLAQKAPQPEEIIYQDWLDTDSALIHTAKRRKPEALQLIVPYFRTLEDYEFLSTTDGVDLFEVLLDIATGEEKDPRAAATNVIMKYFDYVTNFDLQTLQKMYTQLSSALQEPTLHTISTSNHTKKSMKKWQAR